MVSQINTDTGIHIIEEVTCFCELFYDLRSKYLFILFRYGSTCMQTFDKETLTQQNCSSPPPPIKLPPYLFLLKQRHACYNDKKQQTGTSFYYSSRGTILHLSTKLCMTRLQQSLTHKRASYAVSRGIRNDNSG